jgi:hypothetical protein
MLAKLRPRLTYANVMATVAVFIALGGSSYAAFTVTGKNVKNSSLTGKDVKNNSLFGSDVKRIKSRDVSDHSLLAKDFKTGQLPASMFAYVTNTGTLVYDHGVTRASRISAGNYDLTFSRDLTNCVVLANSSIGRPSPPIAANTDPVQTRIGWSGENDNVRVITGNPSRDGSFVVAAFC